MSDSSIFCGVTCLDKFEERNKKALDHHRREIGLETYKEQQLSSECQDVEKMVLQARRSGGDQAWAIGLHELKRELLGDHQAVADE